MLKLEENLPMQTYIAMCWNRHDVAKEILEETDKIDLLTQPQRRLLFRSAILMDRVKFLVRFYKNLCLIDRQLTRQPLT